MMRGCVPALVAALLLAVVAAGCGEGHDSPRGHARMVPAGAVASLPPGSPQRAFIGWWRALQTGDRKGAAQLLPVANKSRLVANLPFLSLMSMLIRPRIVSVERTGGRAVVYTELVRTRRIGRNRVTDDVPLPQGFALRLYRGGWRLTDSFFFVRAGHILFRGLHSRR